MRKAISHLSLLIAIAITIASCSTNKHNLTYFNDIADNTSGTMGESNYSITLEPSDELFISVNSEVPEATADYNLPAANPATNAVLTTSTTPTQQTFIIDPEGNINFPKLGKIHAAGISTYALRDLLTEKISKEVKDPLVKVELMNFKVNVIGEVQNPQVITFNSQRLTIIDAIAAAGDLTEYGNRTNVLVIREQDGKKIYQRLNLQSSEITSSPFFYLKQNDVVYVEPNKVREGNAQYNTNNAYRLSVVSAVVSTVSVIASLIIALAIK